MEQRTVIDETFAGLASPTQTFELGRPDIVEGRPGAALVAEVRDFEEKGGFKKIAAEREANRIEAESDIPSKKPINHVGLDVIMKGSTEPEISDGLKD